MRRLNNEIFFKENFIFAHTCDFLKTLGSGETVPTEVFHEALKKIYAETHFRVAGAPEDWTGADETALVVFGRVAKNGRIIGENFGLTAQVKNCYEEKAIYLWADSYYVDEDMRRTWLPWRMKPSKKATQQQFYDPIPIATGTRKTELLKVTVREEIPYLGKFRQHLQKKSHAPNAEGLSKNLQYLGFASSETLTPAVTQALLKKRHNRPI